MDDLLAKVRASPPLWVVHVGADPDALGAAFALQRAFGGVIGAPLGLSRPAERVARALGVVVDAWPHPERFEVHVAVDTSSRAQLGRLADRVRAPCVVDHHRYGDLLESAPAAAWDPERASCCEVALAVLDHAGVPVEGDVAAALLAGLVSDSARFRYADGRALGVAVRLVEASGWSLERVYALLESDDEAEDEEGAALSDRSRRHAILVAAQRAVIERWGDHLVVASEVGSFDASAATALVRIGADVAVVGRERSMDARLSLRASPRALAAGLRLGEVANEAAREVGWSGGGHDASAGLNGKPPLAAAREAVMRRAKAALAAGAEVA